jgi:hypothetical protein
MSKILGSWVMPDGDGNARPARYTSSVTPYVAVVLGAALLALVFAAGRAREICVLSVRRGRILVMRGGLPASLLEALLDVVTRPGTERATLRVLRDGERARLEASGLDEHAAQRARNVLGTYPLPRLLAGNARQARNLGQRLGSAWLAFRLDDAARAKRARDTRPR